MRQCQNCESSLKPGQRTCPKCRTESKPGAPARYTGAKPAIADPMYGCCDWVGDGQCHYPGVFKHGDRYYCRHHDGCTDPAYGAQIVGQSHIDIPRPDYSQAARKAASLAKVEKDIEAWDNRLKEAA